MGRYDWLYELEPVSIKEKVIEEVARHIASDLEDWPPPVEAWLSAADQARFAPLYADPRRPDDALLRYAFRIVRLELAHEYEAIDFEMRNERWRAHGDGPQDHEALQLLVRWLTDVLLAVKERSGQGLSRADLGKIVDHVEAAVAPSPLRA
jgi:hypothetical protein